MDSNNIFEKAFSDQPIFVLASGQRCGTTLIQRLLNSNPDILIWGEQHGYLNGFLREYRALLEWESEYSHHRKTFLQNGYDNFVPNMLPEDIDLRKAAIVHITALFGESASILGRSIWGFKEVRYDAQMALFLFRCFPKARFIFLTRNIIDCFISLKHWENSPGSWNRTWTEIFIEDWKRINASFLNVSNRIPQLMRVRYEDMVKNPKEFIEKLSSFLSISPDSLDANVFNRKLHVESSDGIIDLRPTILPSDLNSEERSLLSTSIIVDISKEYGYTIEF